jgi:hypothetical protein
MTNGFTSFMRALVVATLLLATAALMFVTVATAKAAGALAVGSCGAYGEAHDYPSIVDARAGAAAQCQAPGCKVVAVTRKGCAAYAVDFANPCKAHGWGKGPKLGRAQNEALKGCYTAGGKDCVIRTFFCDAKG